MKIEVLGTGCAGCWALHETVLRAVAELGIDAEIKKEESLERIIACGVMTLPALVIDGKVVMKGRRPSLDEVKRLLNR